MIPPLTAKQDAFVREREQRIAAVHAHRPPAAGIAYTGSRRPPGRRQIASRRGALLELHRRGEIQLSRAKHPGARPRLHLTFGLPSGTVSALTAGGHAVATDIRTPTETTHKTR